MLSALPLAGEWCNGKITVYIYGKSRSAIFLYGDAQTSFPRQAICILMKGSGPTSDCIVGPWTCCQLLIGFRQRPNIFSSPWNLHSEHRLRSSTTDCGVGPPSWPRTSLLDLAQKKSILLQSLKHFIWIIAHCDSLELRDIPWSVVRQRTLVSRCIVHIMILDVEEALFPQLLPFPLGGNGDLPDNVVMGRIVPFDQSGPPCTGELKS